MSPCIGVYYHPGVGVAFHFLQQSFMLVTTYVAALLMIPASYGGTYLLKISPSRGTRYPASDS